MKRLADRLLTGKRPLIMGAVVVFILLSLFGGDGTYGNNPLNHAEQRVNEYLLNGNSAWYSVKRSEIPIVNRLGAGVVKFFEVRIIQPIAGPPEQPIEATGELFLSGQVAGESWGELAGEVLGFLVLLAPFYLVLRMIYSRSQRFKNIVKKLR